MLGVFKEPWIFCQAKIYLMTISRNEGKLQYWRKKKKSLFCFTAFFIYLLISPCFILTYLLLNLDIIGSRLEVTKFKAAISDWSFYLSLFVSFYWFLSPSVAVVFLQYIFVSQHFSYQLNFSLVSRYRIMKTEKCRNLLQCKIIRIGF